MDYLDFYGLEQEPFSSAPISRFYFNSAQHQRVLVRLMYAVDSMKGLAVAIGELGTGKTTLARRMLDNLPEEEYESALLVIIHSGITADWLLSRIARQLGVENPAPEKLKLLNQLYNRLIELHESGKKAVVLIDEAQMLHSKEIMEEFRGLLNLELPESKLITFVFFGLPELEDYLHLDEPLAQRVALKCTLDCFNFESTEGYVNHRLRLAGAKAPLFATDSLKLIHHYSHGIPRLINTICDNSLFEGYLLKKKVIEPELVQAVATDLGLAPIPPAARKGRNATRQSATVIPVSEARPQELSAPLPFPGTARPVQAPTEEIEPETAEGVTVEPVEEESPEPQAAPADPNPEPPAAPPEPPPFEPEGASEPPAPADEVDAMFNDLTDKAEPTPQQTQTKEENEIDSLFDKLEDK